MAKLPQTNFAHLEQHDEQLLRLGMMAEKYFAEDSNTCLFKLRRLSELLAQLVAARTGQFVAPEETQFDLLRRLQDSGILAREIAQLFGEVRRTGNVANHTLEGDHRGGEFVPQDLNDEPVSVLLARIKADHGDQVASKPKRRRKDAA